MSIGERRTKYESVQHHWTQILATFRFIITQFADELIEIVARAVMLAAPLPNAISIFNTTQQQLGMAWYEALPFALTIEVIVFFLIEVALVMLQRWLDDNGKVYLVAFGAMVVVVLGGTGIVIHLVRAIEPHKVMAWLPVLSLFSFVAIGLKRWDARNQAVKGTVKGVKRSVKFTAPTVKEPVKSFTPRQQEILQWLVKLDGKPAESFVKADLMRDVKISRPTLLNELEILQQAGALNINGTVNVTHKGDLC